MRCGKGAQQLGISLVGPLLESPIQAEEYRRVLAAVAQEHVDGIIISDQAEHFPYRDLIVDLVRAGQAANDLPLPRVF
jgi:DNA-binding LacI/PurR family transcriptional regulator